MIDFRYHLVSLVAVFMALAVGIVLGAGPLGQEISATLEAQVRDLREERNGLRAQLDQAEAREDLKDQTIALVTPTLTAGQLTGRRVALVALPGVDRNIVGQLQDKLTGAGAQVAVTARLEGAWADPENAATRHEIAAELAPTLNPPEPRGGGEATSETVLAAALTGQNAVTGSAAWRDASDRLSEVGFLDLSWARQPDGEVVMPPDSVVVITGDLTTEEVEGQESGDAILQQSIDLIAAFGDLGVPTVVAGTGTESFADPIQSAESPVVRGVRAESAVAEVVSTVDNAEGPSGQLSTVLALRWAVEGQSGHWGLGTDAVGPAPAVPEPVVPEEDEVSDSPPTLPTPPTGGEGVIGGSEDGAGEDQNAGQPTAGPAQEGVNGSDNGGTTPGDGQTTEPAAPSDTTTSTGDATP